VETVSRYQFPELRMSVLHEVLRDLLRVLMFEALGCAVVLLAMAARLAFLRAGELPEWRGLLTLRRPLASELSKELHAYNRQFIRVMLGLAAVLAVGGFCFGSIVCSLARRVSHDVVSGRFAHFDDSVTNGRHRMSFA